ncbi:MAG: hypothetical protein ACTSWN_12865 [Promethearchaeota archaeon]
MGENKSYFQRCDAAQKKAYCYRPRSLEKPAHLKKIKSTKINALIEKLSEKIDAQNELKRAIQEDSLENFIEGLNESDRKLVEGIRNVLEANSDLDYYVEWEERATGNVIWVFPVSGTIDLEKMRKTLYRLGILADKYDFAWIPKNDHYFRVRLFDTQVFMFSREDINRYCRICIVPAGMGKALNTDETYSESELLLLSKIIALTFDLLPTYLNAQIERFLETGNRGCNLFTFDPVIEFVDEYKENYPEIYHEYVVKYGSGVDDLRYRRFSNLRDEIQLELQRLLRIMN